MDQGGLSFQGCSHSPWQSCSALAGPQRECVPQGTLSSVFDRFHQSLVAHFRLCVLQWTRNEPEEMQEGSPSRMASMASAVF